MNFRAVKMHHAHRALADTDGANQNEQDAPNVVPRKGISIPRKVFIYLAAFA